jgi:PKD repeat protein
LFAEENATPSLFNVRNDADVSDGVEEPTASFSFSPAEPVAGQLVQFTDTSTGGSITDWSWDFDDGETSSAQNPSHSFSEPCSCEVKLTVTNSAGSSDQVNQVDVFVNETAPEASFSFTPAEPIVGQAVRFTDMSTGGAAEYWEWKFGDGATSNEQDPAHTYDDPGSYTVELRVANSVGADSTRGHQDL